MTATLHQMLAQEHVNDLLRSAKNERSASSLHRQSQWRTGRAILAPLRRRRGRRAMSPARALPAAEKP